jgi:hypothetical protein
MPPAALALSATDPFGRPSGQPKSNLKSGCSDGEWLQTLFQQKTTNVEGLWKSMTDVQSVAAVLRMLTMHLSSALKLLLLGMK